MFIYAIGTLNTQQKIGYSKNPDQRLKTLQTANAEPLHIHYAFQVDESIAASVEKYLHRQYNHKRIKGEWFEMTPEEIIGQMQYHEMILESIQHQL